MRGEETGSSDGRVLSPQTIIQILERFERQEKSTLRKFISSGSSPISVNIHRIYCVIKQSINLYWTVMHVVHVHNIAYSIHTSKQYTWNTHF